MPPRMAFPWLDQRGVAALEFALTAPVLLLVMGGAIDFGLATLGSGRLASGVNHGVATAIAQGTAVTAASIVTAVQNGARLAGLIDTVTVTVSGPACYCLSGSPLSLPATSTAMTATGCAGTCPSGSAGPYVFMKINASFTYQALMPSYSGLNQRAVTQSAVVRLS